MQAPKHPGGAWGSLLSGILRWIVYGMLFSVLVLVGSAVLRRAAASQNAAGNSLSGMAAAPSLPGAGSAAGYAPREYVKVTSHRAFMPMHSAWVWSCTHAESNSK